MGMKREGEDMAKEITQEQREQFFEEPKGLLGQAVSDARWDSAFKSMTPFNQSATITDLVEYARFHNKCLLIAIEPKFVCVSERDDDGE